MRKIIFRITISFLCFQFLHLYASRPRSDLTIEDFDQIQRSTERLAVGLAYSLTPSLREDLLDDLRELSLHRSTWRQLEEKREQLYQHQYWKEFRGVKERSEKTVLSIYSSLENLDQLIAVDPGSGRRELDVSWPQGDGHLLLKVIPAGSLKKPRRATLATFRTATINLSENRAVEVSLSKERVLYYLLVVENAPRGQTALVLRFLHDGDILSRLKVRLEVPPLGKLKVRIYEEPGGSPTAAAVGLYDKSGKLYVPQQAAPINEGGVAYHSELPRTMGLRLLDEQPSRKQVRPRDLVAYWPVKGDGCFFIEGEFEIDLPAGQYRLCAGKGIEFVWESRDIELLPQTTQVVEIGLRRWIDMPSRGWWSGDAHVHYERDEEVNDRLLLWARAEDIHVSNIMLMGDIERTYFAQASFGKKGRYVRGEYALVPGQEDPRTSELGHVNMLNLKAPIRDVSRYYLYDVWFEAAHRQQALAGYVHVGVDVFQVDWDMSLNLLKGNVDYAEILELWGLYPTDLYYSFLNLGIPLTATAGSDVPWGNTLGMARMYVHTGPDFDVDAWFEGVRRGHTFVTNAPMLEFSVNGEIPGSEIDADKGEMLHVRAWAQNPPGIPPLEKLELVVLGDVFRSVEAEGDAGALELDFQISAERSLWIAARCYGRQEQLNYYSWPQGSAAHTTPVYVRVGGQPWWNLGELEDIVSRHLGGL